MLLKTHNTFGVGSIVRGGNSLSGILTTLTLAVYPSLLSISLHIVRPSLLQKCSIVVSITFVKFIAIL